MRTLVLIVALTLSSDSPSARAAQASGEAPAEAALAPLFIAADASPDGLAPLLLAGSRRIAELDGHAGHELAELLAPYAARAFASPETGAGFESLGLAVHRVAKGEVPGAIARRYRIGDGLLARLNRKFAPTRLQVGQSLKVLDLSDESLRLVVDRRRHRLGAWRTAPGGGWLLVAYLPVGLGAPQTPTPSGTTKVLERVLDPQWRDPVSGVVYAPGAPGNVLGGYWMRLAEDGIGKSGIGLHGYTAEDAELWLGRDASNGCVRMRQDDMDLVYHLALEGTPLSFVP